MVESANKLVVEARLKGAGMHWQRGHVDAMLALRNLLCNDRWEQEWPHIKARLVNQAQHRHFPACQKRLEIRQRRNNRLPSPTSTHSMPPSIPSGLLTYSPSHSLSISLTRLHHPRQNPPNLRATIPGVIRPSAKLGSSNFQNPDAHPTQKWPATPAANGAILERTRPLVGDPTTAIADYGRVVSLNSAPSGMIGIRRWPATARRSNSPRATSTPTSIAYDPTSAIPLNNRGFVHLMQGDDAKAFADFKAAVALDPKTDSAFNGLCWGLSREGQPAAAMSYCEQAVAIAQYPP